MLYVLILIFSLGAFAADAVHYLRRLRGKSSSKRFAFAAWCLLTDSLPVAIALVSFLSRDNDTPFMTFAMWAFFAWIVTVPPRMLFYLFNLLGFYRTGLVAAMFLTVLFLWGATAGRTTIAVSNTEVCSPRIPAAFDGFRIVQISDLHLGTLVRPERELGRLVDSINALHPDLVAFCGDLVNIRASELDARARRILGGIEAPYGVFSVTGNHDVGVYIKDSLALPAERSLAQVLEGQRAMGWQVLEDTTRYVVRGGDSISLSGLSFDPSLRKSRHDRTLPPADLEKTYGDVSDSLFNITLVHLPQLWPQIAGAGYGDVTLSGHVHSMQMKVRLFGRAYSPAQWFYQRWSGRYDEAGRMLYINDGAGYVVFPMRLGAYPEITLITLRRCA